MILIDDCFIKASLGPFPWDKSGENDKGLDISTAGGGGVSLRDPKPPRVHTRSRSSTSPEDDWFPKQLDESLQKLDRTRQVFELIRYEKHIEHKLPRAGITAGRTLAHASAIFERLMAKHSPMSFKFGITHCAHFRWHHRPYGYKYSKEKFSNLLILYASSTPIAPAWLEAALIDKFGSCLAIL